jgi:hypothetical protein
MTQQQFTEITEWQRQTFTEATTISKVEHLKEELEELVLDVTLNKPGKRLEFADCFILLFGAAAVDGMSYQDICEAIQEKFQINKLRKWGKPNGKGVVNHIEE